MVVTYTRLRNGGGARDQATQGDVQNPSARTTVPVRAARPGLEARRSSADRTRRGPGAIQARPESLRRGSRSSPPARGRGPRTAGVAARCPAALHGAARQQARGVRADLRLRLQPGRSRLPRGGGRSREPGRGDAALASAMRAAAACQSMIQWPWNGSARKRAKSSSSGSADRSMLFAVAKVAVPILMKASLRTHWRRNARWGSEARSTAAHSGGVSTRASSGGRATGWSSSSTSTPMGCR